MMGYFFHENENENENEDGYCRQHNKHGVFGKRHSVIALLVRLKIYNVILISNWHGHYRYIQPCADELIPILQINPHWYMDIKYRPVCLSPPW
ncbi:hypothetical protein ACYHQC_003008 [Aeromonas salmonicida]